MAQRYRIEIKHIHGIDMYIYIIEIKHIVISIEVRTARGANEQLLHDCSPASSLVLIDFPHHYI